MNLKPHTPFLAPTAASLAGWMLSGSPVPMGLTVILLPLALLAGVFLARLPLASLGRVILSGGVAALALWVELSLFRDGRALAMRAEMPLIFHVGLALLWWASIDHFVRSPGENEVRGMARGLGGIGGGLGVLGASAGTVLYDFGPWEAHPIAALPLAIWGTSLLFPSLPFSKAALFFTIPTSLVLTGLVLGSTATTDGLRPFFTQDESTSLTDLPPRAPELDGNGPLGDGASRRLPREADVRFRREILVRIKAHSPELYRSWTGAPIYLRTSTLALFENDEVISPVRSGRWLYDQDDGTEDNTIPLRPSSTAPTAPDPRSLHTFYITNAAADHLPLLCGASALHAPAVYEFADDWYQLSPSDEITRLRYTASVPHQPSVEIRPDDLQRPRTEAAPGIYLQLPPSPLSGKIRALAASLDRDHPLAAIRDCLEGQTSYSLRFSTPEDSSPIEEFLFGKGRGHCEHYAAATVLILRSLGIPSRVAYGYAGGIADASQRTLAFRDNDFHAWAEILTPENEWRVFDTTPHVATSAPRIPSSTTLPLVEDSHYRDFSEFDASMTTTRPGWGAIVAGFIAWLARHFFLASAAGLGVLGGLWWLLQQKRGDPDELRFRSGEAIRDRPAVPDFLLELERAGAALGIRRRPGQTWREFLARLAERHTLPGIADEAVSYHYAIAYAGKQRDTKTEERLLASLRSWKGATGVD